MPRHPEKTERGLELLAGQKRTRWVVSVDEIAESEHWLLEIDFPNLYLTFELPTLSVLERAIALLTSTLDRRGEEKHAFVPRTDDVTLGYFGRASVHLLRDNEDFPRCFLVVGPGSRSTLRISLDEDDIRAFAEALAQAKPECSAEADRPAGAGGSVTFVGGPFDRARFDHEKINALAIICPVATESGNRLFLLMPPPEQCDRILRGEATKDQNPGTLHPYERRFLPGGRVEYHYSDRGQFEDAFQPPPPLSAEAQS